MIWVGIAILIGFAILNTFKNIHIYNLTFGYQPIDGGILSSFFFFFSKYQFQLEFQFN